MRLRFARRSGVYALVTVILLLADFLTKQWALYALQAEHAGSMPVWRGVFGFMFVWNEGIAFSLFRDNPLIITILSATILVALCAVIFATRIMTPRVRLAACFIFAGGAGNLIDRLRFGAVVDFINIELFTFPVFNLADIFVTVGAVLYAISLFFPLGRRAAK